MSLPVFVFATAQGGRALLMQRDDFILRLSPFDRSARLHRADPVGEADFLAHLASSVRAWNGSEQAAVQQALSAIMPVIGQLPWPGRIALIRTTGAEEGGAPYTRGIAIVLPDAVFAPERLASLPGLLLHELFHILTRHQPALKRELYACIGFFPRPEPELPESLSRRRITNPDAPNCDYQIQLRIEAEEAWALPLLLADSPHYDPARGGEFFDYLSLRFYFQRKGKAWLAGPEEVQGFYEQVGRNTDYILHPEEILADNFALLMQNHWDQPSPQILTAMAEVLEQG